MAYCINYENGLRVVVEELGGLRTVCSGIWVGAGSAYETSQNNGIAHFTEHMMFKGTDKLSAFQIADAFESLGAMVNAFTGKENTCYYVKSIDEYAERCFELLAHIFFDSVFDAAELDKERNVIVEELNMVEDSPDDLCFDLIAATAYPDNPLGQTILGPRENIIRFGSQDIVDFMQKFYCPQNIVVSFAGHMSPEEADRLVRKYFLPRIACRGFERSVIEFGKPSLRYSIKNKDFEQANVILSFPSLKFDDPRICIQSVMNVILGGGMSSRLFQRIREQLGLAYSVYSQHSAYNDSGRFHVVCNISPSNTEGTVREVCAEIRKFVAEGVTEGEFERAKAQLKSAFIFGRENVQTCMSALGKMMLSANKLFDHEKRIAEINAVTINDVNSFARDILDLSSCSCAYVGKAVDSSIFEQIK